MGTFSRCNATTWTTRTTTWTTIKLSKSSLQLKLFHHNLRLQSTYTLVLDMTTLYGLAVLCLGTGLSTQGYLLLPHLLFKYQVFEGSKLLCDNVSAGEKKLLNCLALEPFYLDEGQCPSYYLGFVP